MMERLTRDDSATKVWVALEKAGERGATRREIQKRTGLTYSQFRNGLGYINHILQEDRSQPISIRQAGARCFYILPEYYSDFLPWHRRQLNDLLTRARTRTTAEAAAVAKWPESAGTRLVLKHLGRVAEDIEDVLAELAD